MGKATILLVDDDNVTLSVVGTLLSREGYTVLTAETAQAGFEALQGNNGVDLMLLDVMLPDGNGIAMCRQLKADARTAQIPIILVSAVCKDDSSILDGLNAGAEGFLLKPVESTALRAWVKATLRISALQRELAAKSTGADASIEEVLRHFTKLSHSVNNPLQALYAAVDMLTLHLPEDPAIVVLTVDILHYAEQVAQLVAQASLQAKALLPAVSHHVRPETSNPRFVRPAPNA